MLESVVDLNIFFFLGQAVLLSKKGSLDLKKNFFRSSGTNKKISVNKPKVFFIF